jgi:hypothetical protein
MRVHSGWTVNAYGPVEDLKAIDVDDSSGAVFNAYENLRNVTFVNGTTNAHGVSNGVGVITFNGGNLRIVRNNGSNFDDAVDNLKNKMAYMEPSSSQEDPIPTVYRGPDGIEIDASAYPWKGGTEGRLILNEGNVLLFHVDSSTFDPTVRLKDVNDDPFEKVNGPISIEEGVFQTITFNGGKLAIINEDVQAQGPMTLPAHSDFWLVRSSANADIQNAFTFDNINNGISFETDFEQGPNGTYKLDRSKVTDLFDMNLDNGYAKWDNLLDVYLFSHDGSIPEELKLDKEVQKERKLQYILQEIC